MNLYVTDDDGDDPPIIVTEDDGDDTVIFVTDGPGPRGEPGPEGPRGPAGSIESSGYTHENPPDDVWVVNHNLGFNPGGVVIMDSAGSIVEPMSIIYDSPTQLTITFLFPFGGTAFMS